MTRNFLTYMSNKETQRANRAYEHETNRHNLETETEINRHNVSVENETNRHNLVLEEQGWKSLAESARHNYAVEQISGGQLALGYAQLAETATHNRAIEYVQSIGAQASQQQAVAAQIQAQASMINARTNEFNANTNRMNADTNRANVDINQQNANTRLMEYSLNKNYLTENQRHNAVTEEQGATRLEIEKWDTIFEGVRDLSSAAKYQAEAFGKTIDNVEDVLKVIEFIKFAH